MEVDADEEYGGHDVLLSKSRILFPKSRSFDSTSRPRDKHHGFTLVELLVVIAVISILASLLLPALETSIKQARRTACQSNHRQHFLATATYADEFRGMLPPTNYWNSVRGHTYRYEGYSVTEASDTSTPRWWGVGFFAALRYLEPDTVFLCPETADNWSSAYDLYQNGTNNLGRLVNAVADPSSVDRIQGPYILNSYPYYYNDSTNPSHGRLGRPGMRGLWDDPDKSAFGSVAHVTALMQCFANSVPTSTSCHEAEGINSTYIDGHVRWLPLGAFEHGIFRQTVLVRDYGNKWIWTKYGLWGWATWKDGE